jgi:hypothetical protein
MKVITLACVVLAVLLAGSAVAASEQTVAFWDGNDLLAMCRSRNPVAVGECVGFVGGIAGAIQIAQAFGGTGWRACRPKAATNVQVRDVAVKFLIDHPGAAALFGGRLGGPGPRRGVSLPAGLTRSEPPDLT